MEWVVLACVSMWGPCAAAGGGAAAARLDLNVLYLLRGIFHHGEGPRKVDAWHVPWKEPEK